MLSRALILASSLLAATSSATIWTVQLDGSGDFTVIQDAVDAAADGDIIEIGPGRYLDPVQYSWGICWVFLDGTKSLTIRGAGADQTVIGPVEYDPPGEDFVVAVMPGDVSLHLEGTTLINGYYGAIANARLKTERCSVRHCEVGVLVYPGAGNSLEILDCEFLDAPNTNFNTAIISTCPSVSIRDSRVVGYRTAVTYSHSGSESREIRGCFLEGDGYGAGIGVVDGLTGGVTDNVIRNFASGMVVSLADHLTATGNIIQNCEVGIALWGNDHVTMENNLVEGCEVCLDVLGPNESEHIRDNHFLRDEANGGYFVTTRDEYPWGPHEIDLTYNYWGTTDLDEIATWIQDGNDDPDHQFYVLYDPIADGGVRVEARSFSQIKQMFD